MRHLNVVIVGVRVYETRVRVASPAAKGGRKRVTDRTRMTSMVGRRGRRVAGHRRQDRHIVMDVALCTPLC